MPTRTNPKKSPLYPRKAATSRWIEKPDGLLVLEERSGRYFKLNRTGAFIWTLSNGTRSIETIAEHLANEYNISYRWAYRHVSSLVSYCAKQKIISLAHHRLSSYSKKRRRTR